MPSLGMEGPYPLTREQIAEVVPLSSPGNYALGRISGRRFTVRYVGRSDHNLGVRLGQWADESRRYTHFMLSHASSPKAAFEKECRNYHAFGESERLDNEQHPDRPDGTNWKCPVCDVYG